MTTWEEIVPRLPLDYVNLVKDELRKIDDIEYAKQILGEAGVELRHVSGSTAQLYWGNGIEQAKRQDVVKKVLERANKIVASGSGGNAPNGINLARLIKEYNHAIISLAAEDEHPLAEMLANLDQRGEPRELHETAVIIRQKASQMRQRLDDDEQYRILPLQSEEFGGPSPDQVRERLAQKCYRVIVAADQVSRISRLLPSADGEDETWSMVTRDPMLQMMREQYAEREIGKSKSTLAAHVRGLLRDLRTIPLESKHEI
jgi:hypothetical protein